MLVLRRTPRSGASEQVGSAPASQEASCVQCHALADDFDKVHVPQQCPIASDSTDESSIECIVLGGGLCGGEKRRKKRAACRLGLLLEMRRRNPHGQEKIQKPPGILPSMLPCAMSVHTVLPVQCHELFLHLLTTAKMDEKTRSWTDEEGFRRMKSRF